MPKKSETWYSFKALRNALGDNLPQQFINVKWSTKKADMENSLQELRDYIARNQQEYKYIEVERKQDTLRITFGDNSTDDYIPEIRTLGEKITKEKPGYILMVTLIYNDGGDDKGRIFKSFETLIARILYENTEKYEDADGVDEIIIDLIKPDANPVIPPMAFSADAMNCVLQQCFEQTHKPSLLKHKTDLFMTIQDIEALEAKHKINVYITDIYNKLWRRPDIIYPKRSKSYPVDVFVCCHNFHASKGFRVTAFAVPHEKKKISPNTLISNFHMSKPSKTAPEYLTTRELMNYHIDLLKQGLPHHVIDNGSAVIGIIEMDKQYKDTELQGYPYITAADWSLGGYARRIFKESILANKNEEQQLQISDSTVYENIHKSQTPICVLFKQKAHGNIVQIDQTQAYKNASIGNLDEDIKHFYEGYPMAPRNTINIDEELSIQLLERLSKLGLGFALISFDQTEHIKIGNIPLLHTGKPHAKGDTVISLPALKYYYLFREVKVHVKQYYYSKYVHYPFDAPVATFDSLGDDNRLTNLLVGGLNRRNYACCVFSTCSYAEAERFLADETKKIHRFKVVDRFEDRIRFLDDVKESKITLHKEYVFYYQNKDDEIIETFNMTHLSKYVLDYQKIALHNKTRRVTGDNVENLLCINTDSIAYISSLASAPAVTKTELWHTEAEGSDFYGYSNGVRCITDEEDIVYQRHSGYKYELTLEDFKVLSDKHNLKVYRQTKKYQLAEEYDTELENTPLPNQRLHTLFRPAGYGKTEFARYLSGKESKFNTPADLPIIEPYTEDSILLTGTTHVARKLLEGKYTIQGLIVRLARGTIKDFDNIKAILIDEISMSSSQQIDKLDRLLRRTKKLNRPFGGLDIYPGRSYEATP
jgi:hypothetical protein